MERFGAYEIERRLGVGGMAEVFVAVRRGEQGFAKRLVLKRVLPAFSQDAEFVRAFHDEARLAAHLAHPAITSVYDFGQVSGTWFMAMEFVDGADLRKVLAALRELGQPMPIDLILLVAQDLAQALAYAHGLELDGRPLHIIHRDISPSNVLLSVDGAVKLADFGVARAAVHHHKTESGVVKGKVPYMAPEQALGKPMDGRVDLFALGVVLYEALAGRRPYDGVTDLDTLQNLALGRRAPLLDLAPHTPLLLARAVERLIDPDPNTRFASAAEFLDALASSPAPANARLTLGALVRRLAAIEPPSRRSSEGGAQNTLALAATAHATPSGPSYAPPGANTRTRLRPPEEIPATASSPTHPTPFTTSSTAPTRKAGQWRRPVVGLAALVAVLGVAGAIATVWPSRGAQTSETTTAATPATEGNDTATMPDEPLPGSVTTPPATDTLTQAGEEPVAAEPTPTARRLVRPARPDRIEQPAQPELAAQAPAVAEPPPPVAAASTSDAPPAEPEPVRDGRLTIVAIPFGEVSIDDRPVGDAPITLPLRPGEHRVVVRSGVEVERRVVTIEPGAAQRSVFRFGSH